MSRLVLAKEFDGQLRYWRDELVTAEPNHMIRHLANRAAAPHRRHGA